MKRLTRTLAALALTAALVVPASASNLNRAAAPYTLTVAGQNIWHSAKARVVNNTTYVSLRTVAGFLAPNAQVSWSGGAARIDGAGVSVAAVPGQTYLTVNERALYIAGGVQADSGSVLVPIRVLAEALGGGVEWSRERGVTLTVGSGVPDGASYTADDLYWLSRIISAESRGESLRGKLAVGSVVLNRVASKEFPNDVYSVIFDDKWGIQFTPVANGTIYENPTEESVLAAKLVLEGAREAGDSLYFLAPELTDNHWIMETREYVTTIGCHWFYR